MLYNALFNSEDGMIVVEVNGRRTSYCTSLFTYKDENGTYHLVDIDTGLSIACSKKLKNLEERYYARKNDYEAYKKTDAYNIKVERFKKLILVNNAKGNR